MTRRHPQTTVGLGRRLLVLLALAMAPAVGVAAHEASQAKPKVTIGGPFALVDQHGALRQSADFWGSYLLVTFGYTSCPDLCPTTLYKLGSVLEELDRTAPARARRLVPIFITVDPERDTPEALSSYAEAFDPRWVMLIGAPKDIVAVSRAYGVFAARSLPDADGWYQVDHASLVYLMAPNGEYLSHFEHDATVEELVQALNGLIEADEGAGAKIPARGSTALQG